MGNTENNTIFQTGSDTQVQQGAGREVVGAAVVSTNQSSPLPAKREIELPDSKNLMNLADSLLKSQLFPQAKSVYGVATIIEYGRELGLPPVAALQTMSVIKGRIAIESKALLSIAIKGGVKVQVIEKTKEKCRLRFTREGYGTHEETFSMEDAKRAGLNTKDVWRQYPEEMLYWRCVAKGLRVIAPDLILGLYTKEEMESIPLAQAQSTADVVDAEVIETVPEQKEPEQKEQEAQPDAHAEQKVEPKTDINEEVEIINAALEANMVDKQHFCSWLAHKYPKHKFCRKKYKAWSFREGDPWDVHNLSQNILKAIETYRKDFPPQNPEPIKKVTIVKSNTLEEGIQQVMGLMENIDGKK